jgi:hypothetical protein
MKLIEYGADYERRLLDFFASMKKIFRCLYCHVAVYKS